MKVVVADLLTNYADDGPVAAPTILLLHGWGADLASFAALTAGLQSKFRVIRLDLPGFGGSQRPHTDWLIQDYAQFVRDFLIKLEVPELAAVAGHSFGGRIVIKALSEGLIPARRAILIDSAGLKPRGSWRRSAYTAAAKTGKLVLSLPGLSRLAPDLRRRLYQSAGSTDYLSAGAMRQIFLNAIREDQAAQARNIRVPVLLIWGGDDLDTPPADGQRFAALIPNAQLSVLAGAGHFAHVDAPDRVLALIQGFIV